MVVPDGVVQTQALVPVAPAIAGPRILLDDDRGHAEFPQARTEDDAGLSAPDHHDVRLRRAAEGARFFVAAFEPGLAILERTMLDALRAVLALLLLEALQFLQRGEKRPRLAAHQPEMAAAAAGCGFEREPCLGHAAGLAALALDRPVRC